MEVSRVLWHSSQTTPSNTVPPNEAKVLQKLNSFLFNEVTFKTALIAVRFDVIRAVTMKNSVFWDIKTRFILHRGHITSLLESPTSYWYIRFEVFTAVSVKNGLFCDIKPRFVIHRGHITSLLVSPAS
jgi:hypothetical protein